MYIFIYIHYIWFIIGWSCNLMISNSWKTKIRNAVCTDHQIFGGTSLFQPQNCTEEMPPVRNWCLNRGPCDTKQDQKALIPQLRPSPVGCPKQNSGRTTSTCHWQKSKFDRMNRCKTDKIQLGEKDYSYIYRYIIHIYICIYIYIHTYIHTAQWYWPWLLHQEHRSGISPSFQRCGLSTWGPQRRLNKCHGWLLNSCWLKKKHWGVSSL